MLSPTPYCHQVARYLTVERTTEEEHEFRKTRPGRAGTMLT